MGHMTQIANKLHIAVGTRQEVAEHVQDTNQWQDYLTTQLAPRNEVSCINTHQCMGGHVCAAFQQAVAMTWKPAYSCPGLQRNLLPRQNKFSRGLVISGQHIPTGL